MSKCVPYKDFGQGFYVTASMEQAENFVRLSLKRAAFKEIIPKDTKIGYVSKYQLEIAIGCLKYMESIQYGTE